MSPPPQNKRKRTLSPTPQDGNTNASEGSTYVRNESVYFDDGNIVLVTEKTAFRVYKGQLAHQSDVFREALTVVTKPLDAEEFEGCPVVQLSDSRDDLAALLGALYCVRDLEKEPYAFVAGVLRLATKYLIDALRQRALNYLGQFYPCTLNKWDAFEGARPPPGEVISLCRETGANVLLTAALYGLCGDCSADLELVPIGIADLRLYIKGRNRLVTIWPEFIREHWSTYSAKPCPRDKSCGSTWPNLLFQKLLNVSASQELTHPDPLQQLKVHLDDLTNSECLCIKHWKEAKKDVDNKRAEIWSDLPKTFGLGNWDGLQG